MQINRRTAALLGASLLASLLVPGTGTVANAAKKADSRVVVAVIDEGFNPYHEFFHAGGGPYKKSRPSSVTPAVLREFGISKDNIIKITRTGDFAADFAKDRRQFEKIKEGKPYWFKGTNLIGISFSEDKLRPDAENGTHGIGTAASVLTANPEAIVVHVEGINAKAEGWAFTEPAVDIVSTSYGPITSVPTLANLDSSYKGVVGNGKAHFGAAANDPTYATFDETAGPWWSIGIGGFEEGDGNGRQITSGSVSDFVGDFTQDLPYCRLCQNGTRSVSGTSFATPLIAGTFSKILLEARRAAGHPGGIVKSGKEQLLVAGKHRFTVWEMRRALEIAAHYPTTSDYNASEGATSTAMPVNDAAPWLQVGWGLVTPDRKLGIVKETLAQLKVAGKPKADKPQGACDFMTANMEIRRAYWENLAARSEGFGQSEDPYIYC